MSATSTAVGTNVKGLAALGKQYGALVIVDGVCSVAGEEMRQEEWGIDLALTASQKAIGVPPGLALVMAGPRAMDTFHNRKQPVSNYYADWTRWLPIMESVESHSPLYFGTPPVNHIWALNVSLGQILEEGITEAGSMASFIAAGGPPAKVRLSTVAVRRPRTSPPAQRLSRD